jgi:hypothetical protein
VATWDNWNYTYTATNATTAASTDDMTVTWAWWNNNVTGANNSTTIGLTWTSWTSTGNNITAAYQPYQETEEERAAREERLRASVEAQRVRAEEARLAVEKAEALLQAHLDEEQQAMLKREAAFLVSVKSGRKYKVKRGQRGNVHELDDQGHAVREFCIHPDDVPDQDAMLAQKLLLETDEASFRRIANITELRRSAA